MTEIRSEIVNMETLPKPRSRKVSMETLKTNLTKSALKNLIDNKVCKVNELAVQYNASPANIKLLITEYFEDAVEFKRGRTGGVCWTEAKSGNS